MDTLLQDLRSAFTVAAVMSLGLGLQSGPTARVPAPRPERGVVRAVRVIAPPHRRESWMDYIDFRRGSGDVLRWIGTSTSSDEPQPHHCGQ